MAPLLAALALAAAPIHVERNLHYGRSAEQTLDAYVAPGARRAVVLIHGGGWRAGSKESLDPTALRFAQSGWTAFSISYRLVPPAPWYAAEDDALTAVRWVRAHAARFGFDPRRLDVFGTSAGGNLAALVATVGSGRHLVAAAASWSGPMDLATFVPGGVIRRYAGCECPGRLLALSPVSFVGAGDAPLLLANSTRELVPLGQAIEMARRLARAGIPHRLLVYPGSRHAVAYERDAWQPTLRFLASRTDAAALPAGFRVYSYGPAGGEIWRGVIPGARRASMIYVPPGYSAAQRYPVVYLLAGMPGSPWSYVHSLSLAAVADTLIARGRTTPFVAVMPPAGPSGHYDGEWAGAVGALPRVRRPPLGGRTPRRLRRPHDRGPVGRRVRRGRHRASSPAALPPRRGVGRLLPAVPRRTAPPRLGGGARRPRSHAPPADRGRDAAQRRHALLPLDRPGPRPRHAGEDGPLRAAAPLSTAPVPPRASRPEARSVGAAARRRLALGLRA
jgi:acetyl esterase/lipase